MVKGSNWLTVVSAELEEWPLTFPGPRQNGAITLKKNGLMIPLTISHRFTDTSTPNHIPKRNYNTSSQKMHTGV